MHPILFNFFGITVYSWGFMVALGFVAAILIAVANCKREGLTYDQVVDISFYVLIFSMLGARLFYIIQFWSEFSPKPISIFYVWEGGMVFYGGLIFAIATVYIYSKIKKISFVKILDLAAVSSVIGYSIGRIGCFLRGCCYGIECAQPWAVHFPEIKGWVHPTQIYSSIAGLIIFTILTIMIKKKKYDGQVFLWGLLLYSVYRFLIEFLRYSPYYYFGLTASQWISAVVFVLALIFIAKRRK